MARSRLAASSSSFTAPLMLLVPPATLLALLLAALASAPAADARFLQARPSDAALPWSGVSWLEDDAPAASLAALPRERRSPREQVERQEDSEPVDPEQKPEKCGIFKRIWNKVKEYAKKVVEAVRDIMEVFGCFDNNNGNGGSGGNAETMSPDRRLQNESDKE